MGQLRLFSKAGKIDPNRYGYPPARIELQILNGAKPDLIALARIGCSVDAGAVLEQRIHFPRQIYPVPELLVPQWRVVDFDQERTSQFAILADQFVVRIDFVDNIRLSNQ